MLITIILFLPKANANPVEDFGNKIKTWWQNEKTETYYYQNAKNEEGKDQLKDTLDKIKNFFGKTQ